MASWHTVAQRHDIPLQGARVIQLGDMRVAVFRTVDDRLFALEDRCPHRGGPLSDGIVHGQCVTCPLHSWTLDLASGSAVGPDEGAVRTFPVRLVQGAVQIHLTRERSHEEPSNACL
jgi:nitrite reductase (NADH) small subunit